MIPSTVGQDVRFLRDARLARIRIHQPGGRRRRGQRIPPRLRLPHHPDMGRADTAELRLAQIRAMV